VQDSSKLNYTHSDIVGDVRDIEGIWMGNLTIPGGLKLRIVFNISTNPDGSINASMDSPDQGVSGIPVETVSYKDGNLNLGVKTIRGSFEGIYKENNKTIEGEWKQEENKHPYIRLKPVPFVPETNLPPLPLSSESLYSAGKEFPGSIPGGKEEVQPGR